MSGDSPASWCLIESDPGVFTELVASLGVKHVQFEEIYSLEEECFLRLIDNYGEIYGIIFLFKWTDNKLDPNANVLDPSVSDVFFAKQVIPNACATQAILFVLMNHANEACRSPALRELKQFTAGFDPVMKGLALSNSDVLRAAHNSFKCPSTLELIPEEPSGESGDGFHYVSYVPFDRWVLELDGLKPGPVIIGDLEPDDRTGTSTQNVADAKASARKLPCWVDLVRYEIARRIKAVQATSKLSDEIRFNVMAVVGDAIEKYTTDINQLKFELLEDDDEESAMIDSATAIETLRQRVAESTTKIQELEAMVRRERAKRQRWDAENSRRRHDLVPLTLCALRHLTKKGLLKESFERAVLEATQRQAEQPPHLPLFSLPKS